MVKSKLVLTICFQEKLNRNYLTQKMRKGIFEILKNLFSKLIWVFKPTRMYSFGGWSCGRVFWGTCVWICGWAPTLECNLNKAARGLCWGRNSVWVLSCQFPAYFLGCLFMRLPLESCFCIRNVDLPSTHHLTHYICVLKH